MHSFPWSQLWRICISLIPALWAYWSRPRHTSPLWPASSKAFLDQVFKFGYALRGKQGQMQISRWNHWVSLVNWGGARKHACLTHTRDGLWNTLWETLPWHLKVHKPRAPVGTFSLHGESQPAGREMVACTMKQNEGVKRKRENGMGVPRPFSEASSIPSLPMILYSLWSLELL